MRSESVTFANAEGLRLAGSIDHPLSSEPVA
jgi:hypothetical protein